jgi:multiple sugar transport system substrate-binding protein
VALAVAATLLAACGGGDEGIPTLTWYTNPDAGGQAILAQRCTEAAGGRYDIRTAVLPQQAAAQREQLVRRLAAKDASIDLMSLDPPFIPEFAEAGFLAPVPEDVAPEVTEGVVDPLVVASTWNDQLAAVPFWANTQLLWYRKSAAAEAGLDFSQPVTWQQLLDAAQQTDRTLAVQGARAESLTVWLNALVESAGGEIIANPEAPADETNIALDQEPAVQAAEIMRSIATAGVTPAGLDTADEPSNATSFIAEDGAFMVNWPFVWAFTQSAVEAGTAEEVVLDDIGWTIYPRVDEGTESAPPLGGISLGVGAFSENTDLAFEAAQCITSAENQAFYMINDGNPAGREEVYDEPKVLEVFPMAPLILESLRQAEPRPQTPYYSEVSGGLQRMYHPYVTIDPGQTGEAAAELIEAVLRKEQLL